MAERGLPISTFVKITTPIAAGGSLRTEYGAGLLVTTEDGIPAGGAGKIKRYADIEAVMADFATGEALAAARVWFGGDAEPHPLFIGRWATAPVPTTLTGGVPGAPGVAPLTAANGSLSINGIDVTGVNLSATTTAAAVATAVQAALRTVSGFGAATFAYNATLNGGVGGYVITVPTVPTSVAAAATFGTGTSEVVVTADAAGAAGNNISVALVDPSANNQTLSVSVVGQAITASLATGAAGAITTTAAQLTAAINANAAASALVTATGAGVGIVAAAAATNLTGGATVGVAAAITDGALGDAATGTAIATALGLDSASSPVYAQGHVTETLSEALAEMLPQSTASVDGAQASGGSPTLPMVDGSCPAVVGVVDTRESLATFVQAGEFFAFIRDNGTDALASSGTFRHYVFSQQLSSVEAVVGAGENFGAGTTNYIDVAANAFLSSQRFALPASIKNPHLKPMPGATAILVDGDQLADLVATRTSVYTVVGGLPSLAGGYTGRAGVWADAQYWLGWLKNELEIGIFNGQRGSDRFATALLTDIINDVMATASRTGGIGLGARVTDAVRNQIRNTFSRPDFDGILVNGWMPWIEQPSSRSDLDRENRIGRFRIWIAPADAINEVVGSITLST